MAGVATMTGGDHNNADSLLQAHESYKKSMLSLCESLINKLCPGTITVITFQ